VGCAMNLVETRNAYSIFVGRPKGKRQLGGYRPRFKTNIKLKLKNVICEAVDRIHLTQNRI
jgi:hypothetical protein